MYSQDSIDLLQNSGLQFKKHEEEGIDTLYFAELLMTSGLVLCENVKWLSFHRSVLTPLSTLLIPVQKIFNPCFLNYKTQIIPVLHFKPIGVNIGTCNLHCRALSFTQRPQQRFFLFYFFDFSNPEICFNENRHI